jgi:heme-degrading monooxygenase HmoA
MKQPSIVSILFFLLAIVPTAHAFTSQAAAPRTSWNVGRRSYASSPVTMVTTDVVDTDDSLTSDKGLLKRVRYIATNRFAVRKDQQAKFEKRWTVRKSKLATLEGFKYFHLMRRVKLQDDGITVYDGGDDSNEEAQNNYVSFTVWEKKSHFSAWRSGEAFKEAHGGTSISAFLTTMVSSAFVLRGAPKPAFYDAVLMDSKKPETMPVTVDGWRSVEADGENTIPVECFVGMENFFIPPEHAYTFEQFWASRKSSMAGFDGFVAFTLMRRDGQTKGHGTVEMTSSEPTYTATLIFKDRKSFENWGGTHGAPKPKEGAEVKAPPPKMWSRDPEKVFYEGTLVITNEDGP